MSQVGQPSPRRFTKRILSAQSIRGLPPPTSGSVEYFDDSTPGLSLRITPKRTRTWSLLYRANGIQKRLTLGRYPAVGLADARELAQQAQRTVAKGGDPVGDKRAARHALTFEELAAEYIERYAKLEKKSWAEDQRQIDANLRPVWKMKAAEAVSRRDVRDLLDSMAAQGARIGANRTRALISKIYNFGLERELVDQNPAIGVAKVTRERSRERVLTADELRRVWAACDTQSPHVAAWFRLRLATAQRGGEILRMRWQDRIGEWWTVPADFVKNRQGHRVYLNPIAREILAGIIPTEGYEWVFPESLMGDFKHVSRRLARENRANVSDFRGHDLRRTAASVMTSGGVPRFIVARILNHSESRDITGVYDRYSYDREKRAAMVFWAKQLCAMLADQPLSHAGRFQL